MNCLINADAKESAKKDQKTAKNEHLYHFFTQINDFI